MRKLKSTGILKIKRKKFQDEVLVLYLYNGNVVYAYSPFSGETVMDIRAFLSGVIKSYKWDLEREFVEMSDEEIIEILKIPGIRNDSISREITLKLQEILEGHKGILSYAVFDNSGFLVSGYNFDPSYVPRFVKTYSEVINNLKSANIEFVEFFLTRHESERISLFFPLKGGYLFFFMFDSSILHMGYVVSSLINEIKSELKSII